MALRLLKPREGPTPEQPPTAQPSLIQRLMERTAALRANFKTRIQEVNAMTERSVMAAARSAGEIVERASAHVAATKRAFAKIDGEGGEHGVSAAISRQQETISRYHETLSRSISSQQTLAARAEENLLAIERAAEAVALLTREAHILSLNARIEAVRLGASGTGFSVIAGEMQRLSKQVGDASELINDLAQRLSNVLPAITAGGRAMRNESEHFSQALSESSRELGRATQEMHEVMRRALQEGDSAAASILRTSHDALSHLQFQDAVAQGLMRMDKWVYDLQVEQAEGAENPPVIEPPMHLEIGDEKPVDQEQAGEVLLF